MSKRDRLQLVLVLGSLIAIGPLTIDMYLPALPAITAGLETTETAVQLTLTGTLLGLSLGQLLIGSLSDVVGRRPPLLAGLAAHVLASVLCVFAPNIATLGVLRVVQGLGVAAAAVVATAVIRDLFSGDSFARVFSRLMLVMSLAPILAPTLGSALLRWTEWRGVFAALAVLGAVLVVIAALRLPETLPVARRRHGGMAGTLRDYRTLLNDRAFVGLVLVAGLAMAALFGYISGSSFVLQTQYGLDEQQFGVAFGAGAVGLIAGTQLNVRLLHRYTSQQILVSTLIAGTAAGLLLILLAVTGVGGLAALLATLWLVLATIGLALPNGPALAMSRHSQAAGTAAALLGAVQCGIGALSAPLAGLFGTGAVPMAVVIAGGMAAALAVMVLVVPRAALRTVDPDLAVALH
ncbi:multidrug effflux MFS transporter [Micromonospora orduensis]|uniref:Multidrug effflux MFS transporter n=2 Tax=Micromonospora orduensis TaxID=1420891 RepID=A0A5C4QT31_9ACTN|nr:multidrug effflux MFS transporter [Micromonospora orduensis]